VLKVLDTWMRFHVTARIGGRPRGCPAASILWEEEPVQSCCCSETSGRTGYLSRGLGLIIALVSVMSGCKPSISSFSVTPRRICFGDTVSIRFKTSGQPRLTVVSRGGDPEDTTTYTLVAEKRKKLAFARQDVIRVRPGPPRDLLFIVTSAQNDSVQAFKTLSGDAWESSLRLKTLATAMGRPVRVRHAGREAVLGGDGTPSPVFTGLSFAGPWELAAALLPGESIGGPTPPPDRFRLSATVACEPGAVTP
jgi:hypothetical protein